MVLLFKKGSRADRGNYIPVLLMAICGKVLEHILRTNIWKHLDLQDIIIKLQHGFRKKMSCETQLSLVAHDISGILNRSGQVDGAVLDFSKAFNKVPHEHLLLKL